MSVRSKACAIATAVGVAACAHTAFAQSGSASGIWEGPYAGGHVGFVYLDVDAAFTGPAVGADIPFSQDMNGVGLGAFAGYNFRQGPIVFGPEIDLSWLIGADSRATPGGAAGMDAFVNGHVRGRAGYLIAEDLLLFGALGVAVAGVEVTRVPAGLTPVRKENAAMFGLSVGAGAEYAVMDDVHLRLDYIYDHYFRQSVVGTEPFGGRPFFPEIRARTGSHTVRIGVSIDLY